MKRELFHTLQSTLESTNQENEDAFKKNETQAFHMYAIADGAGGAGIFCKSWAEFLVSNQPNLPFSNIDEYKDWFLNVSKHFYDDITSQLKDFDPMVAQKFYEEGSYSTLLFLWMDKKRKEFFVSGSGDTTLFLFDFINDKFVTSVVFPINYQLDIDQPPKLVNWRKEIVSGLLPKNYSYGKGSCILICTDSLARWVICHLMLLDPQNLEGCLGSNLFASVNQNQIKVIDHIRKTYDLSSVGEFLNHIRENLKDEAAFKKFIIEKTSIGEIETDDFTILMIENM